MECGNCGKTLPEDANFCNDCGTSVWRLSEEANQPPQPPATPAKPDRISRGRIVLIVTIAVLVLGAFFAGIGVWAYRAHNKSKGAEEYLSRARSHLDNKEYQEAIDDAEQALLRSDKLEEAYEINGLASYGLKDYEDAYYSFNKALDVDPGNARLYIERGYVEDAIYWFEDAAFDFSIGIKQGYPTPDVFAWRARSYLYLRKYQEAMDDINKAIDMQPQDSFYHVGKALIYGGMYQYDQALAEVNSALTLNPNEAEAYSVRGAIYNDLKNYKQALADSNKAIELDPQLYTAYIARADAYVGLGNDVEARDDCYRALNLEPWSSGAYTTLGAANNNEYAYQIGLDYLNRALDLWPENARALKDRGIIYYNMGQYDNAKADLQKAMDLDPQLQEAGGYLKNMAVPGG